MNDGPLVVNKIDTISFAMRVILEEVIARLLEKPFKGVKLELQQRPFVHIAGAVDAHLATGPGQIGRLVVLQPVGLDHHVAPAQHGVAFNHSFQIGTAKQVVAHQEGRQGTAHAR